MLPSKRKVGKKRFEFLNSKGKNFHSGIISLRSAFVPGEITRISVVVPKKIEKSAVKRNYIKRRIYALIKNVLPNLKSGYLCVFFVKKSFEPRANLTVKEDLLATLQKAGVMS